MTFVSSVRGSSEISLYAFKISNDLVIRASTRFLTLIERVINLKQDIEVEVIIRILLLIIIDKTSFIDFKLIRFNKVL